MEIADLIKEFLVENGCEVEIADDSKSLTLFYPMNEDGSIVLAGLFEIVESDNNTPMIYHRFTDSTINIADPGSFDELLGILRHYEEIRRADLELLEKSGVNAVANNIIDQMDDDNGDNHKIRDIARVLEMIDMTKTIDKIMKDNKDGPRSITDSAQDS